MGFLFFVNRGSVYEFRVVVIEYNGDKDLKEKIVMIGKGIIFDLGGYLLKFFRLMVLMKFDMFGLVIVVVIMKVIV